MTERRPTLHIDALKVVLPGGAVLIEDLSMTLHPGEVAVLLGASGSGKSTFSKVLFDRRSLEAQGFEIDAETLHFDEDQLCLVPQRGALFDHLKVGANIELAQRYTGAEESDPSPSDWLENVGLHKELAHRSVDKLSGGQAQRVSVARALASRRQLLLLDEPSVGLDPHRVRLLARLIREQVEKHNLAAIVVTHDPALAAGVADALYLLDPEEKRLKQLFKDEWPGPVEAEGVDEETRGRWMLEVEEAVVSAVRDAPAKDKASSGSNGSIANSLARQAKALTAPFAAAAYALTEAPQQLARQPADFARIAWRVLRQSSLRPLPFYAVVSTLIGFTILFVISKVGGAGIKSDALIRQIGGSYAVALGPPLSAILFIAASGSATNAWLGTMGLTQQTSALEALGIRKERYLWAPTWFALGLSYLAIGLTVVLGMLLGGWLLCRYIGVAGAWELLSADILDPRPERSSSLGRAIFLLWMYAWGMASDVVAKGGSPKASSEAITTSMTRSVVACTLWMVALELVTVLWVFGD